MPTMAHTCDTSPLLRDNARALQPSLKAPAMPKLFAPAIVFVMLAGGCASTAESPAPAPSTQGRSQAQLERREDAEVVTGSRIPVRGAQPVRTIDKEEITRNTSVIGTPPKGN